MTKQTAYKISKWLLGGFLAVWSIAQVFFCFRYQSVDLPGLDFAIIAAVCLFVFWRANSAGIEKKKEPIQSATDNSGAAPRRV